MIFAEMRTRLCYLFIFFGNILLPSILLAQPSLKQAFKNDFFIGAALNRPQISGQDARAINLAKQQFNCISPENILKWENVHPRPGVYHFKAADQYVQLGLQHDMWIHGHTLVWYKQTPDWVFETDDKKTVNRKTLLHRMKEHIETVAGRYKGKIDSWDVVNEAIDTNGNLRNSRWRKIIGDDYITKAFEYAHEAAPDAKLYYNDFDLWIPAKREGVIRMIKKLQAEDVPINGLGLQTHVRIDYPDLQAIKASLEAFSKLNIKLAISELDVDVLPRPANTKNVTDASIKKWNPYPNSLPDSLQHQLAERYQSVFKLLMNYKSKIERVTFWGVDDRQSWLNYWPVGPRRNYPLLFDRNYEPKPAFNAVLETADR